jgi:hypothetical protein
LLRAAAIVHKDEPNGWHVVLVGDYQGDSFLSCHRELVAARASLAMDGTDGDRLRNSFADDDLALLYNAARQCSCSLHKGEGFACGCRGDGTRPDWPSLPATATRYPSSGGAGMLFDPDSDTRSQHAMLRMLR